MKMTDMQPFKCPNCKKSNFRHMHDMAYQLPGTHMLGSERFECLECGRSIFKYDKGAENFTFIFD